MQKLAPVLTRLGCPRPTRREVLGFPAAAAGLNRSLSLIICLLAAPLTPAAAYSTQGLRGAHRGADRGRKGGRAGGEHQVKNSVCKAVVTVPGHVTAGLPDITPWRNMLHATVHTVRRAADRRSMAECIGSGTVGAFACRPAIASSMWAPGLC